MINKCKCLVCGDVIESKHRHDWVPCMCGAIFTDGGSSYIRRGYGEPKVEEYKNRYEQLVKDKVFIIEDLSRE